MKAGWEVKALGEVCQIGSSKRVLKSQWTTSGVPFYRAREIVKLARTGKVKNDLFISEEHFRELKAGYGVPEIGDLMISAVGTLGACYVVQPDDRFYFKDASVLQFRPSSVISPEFLRYAFDWDVLKTEVATSDGATVGTFTISRAKSTKIPLPPLEEQKRIVAVLDAAFEGLTRARTHIETNLQNARELFDEHSRHLLSGNSKTWRTAKLSEVCEKITDGTHQTPTYFDEGYIFLSSKNVTSRRIDWDNVKYIDEAQHIAMHKRIAPMRGDILLAKNGTTGVAAMVDRDVVFDIYVSLAHLRPLSVLTSEFLLYFVNSAMAKEQFNSRLKGQGVPNLHLKEIREVLISFPEDKVEQTVVVSEIENLLEKTASLASHYSAKLQDLDDLRQSLLQRAFAGELT